MALYMQDTKQQKFLPDEAGIWADGSRREVSG
jgi:hypothetical protein